MKLLEKLKALFEKKLPPLPEYAIVLWHPESLKDPDTQGDKYKEIHHVAYGKRRTEPYSREYMELLELRGVPVYDATEGFDRPIQFLKPTELIELRTSLVVIPRHPLRFRW